MSTDTDRLVRALKAGDRVDELLLAVQGDLNLYYRHIGNLGAMSLSALKINTTIVSLDLGGCDIGTEGVVPLANALSLNTTITKVLLGNNCIDDDGVAILAEAMVRNIPIKHLGLSGNKINEAGLRVLTHALARNSTVTQVDVGGNLFGDGFFSESDKHCKTLAAIFKRNKAAAAAGPPSAACPWLFQVVGTGEATEADSNKKYVYFTVRVERDAQQWELRKRYSQFDALDQRLALECVRAGDSSLLSAVTTGFTLPAQLPPKHYVRTHDADSIEARRVGLDAYLHAMVRERPVYQSVALAEFLSPASGEFVVAAATAAAASPIPPPPPVASLYHTISLTTAPPPTVAQHERAMSLFDETSSPPSVHIGLAALAASVAAANAAAVAPTSVATVSLSGVSALPASVPSTASTSRTQSSLATSPPLAAHSLADAESADADSSLVASDMAFINVSPPPALAVCAQQADHVLDQLSVIARDLPSPPNASQDASAALLAALAHE